MVFLYRSQKRARQRTDQQRRWRAGRVMLYMKLRDAGWQAVDASCRGPSSFVLLDLGGESWSNCFRGSIRSYDLQGWRLELPQPKCRWKDVYISREACRSASLGKDGIKRNESMSANVQSQPAPCCRCVWWSGMVFHTGVQEQNAEAQWRSERQHASCSWLIFETLGNCGANPLLEITSK